MLQCEDERAARRRGALLVTVGYCLVGGSFSVTGTLVGYPHAGGQALRYALACALLVPLLGRGWSAPLRALTARQWVRLALLAATGTVGFNMAVLAAERTAEPAVPGVLVGCAPIAVAVLAPLLDGRRPARPVIAGAVLVAAGAFVVQGWGGTDAAGLGWSVAALAGEVSFAVLSVPVLRPLGPRLLSACVCAIAAAEALLLGVLTDGRAALRMPGGAEALALGWQAGATTVVGFVCWYAGVQRIGAERATLFSGLIPLSAALTAPVIGVGTYGPGQLAGGFLVAAGVAAGTGLLAPLGRRSPVRQPTPKDGSGAGTPARSR